MEENAAKHVRHMKYIGCPGCGKPLVMDMNLCRIDSDIYVWFEGLCGDCQHKVADPMPIVRAEMNDEAWKILAN